MRELKYKFVTTDYKQKNVPLALKRIQKQEPHPL